MTPQLGRIAIYPIKSLDPVVVDSSRLVELGALEFDREYAIFHQDGKWLSARRCAPLHRLRTTYGDNCQSVAIHDTGSDERFRGELNDSNEELAAWLSDLLQQPLTVRRNRQGGFPDEMNIFPGPTIVSRATLETVTSWYPGKTLDEIRRRFRANLEIAGVPAFWEDCLVGPPEQQPRLRIGGVTFHSFQPCARCVMVTRHPQTGSTEPAFQKTFQEMREKTLPSFAPRATFNHFFRLAINSHVDQSCWTSRLQVGDKVELLPTAR